MVLLQRNLTLSSEFIILGFEDLADLQIFIFGFFLIMHLVTLAGHMTIVLITLFDSCLQTPIYFFLRNLSTIEICYILVIVPNMLANFMSGSQWMPFLGCALKCISSSHWVEQSVSSWPWWPMTTLWPSASPFTTHSLSPGLHVCIHGLFRSTLFNF